MLRLSVRSRPGPLMDKRSYQELKEARAARKAKPALARTGKLKAKHKTKGGRNSLPDKLKWLRTLECMIVASPSNDPCHGRVESHHDRKMGAPANDLRTVPACTGHHRTGTHSVENLGRAGFEAFHRVTMDDAVAHYESLWQESQQ